MKRLILLALSFCLLSFGQQVINIFPPVSITNVTVDPAGSCSSGPLQYNTTNGKLWGCDSGTWTLVTGTSAAGITTLTGDVTAGPGSGSQAATVLGIKTVPLCSGFTPTNGQALQYTTSSSPNPCWTAAAAGGAGTAAFSCPVSGASFVTCTHNLNTATPWVTCFDGSGNMLGGSGASTGITSVVATSVNAATVTFSGTTTATCSISSGSMGPQGVQGIQGNNGAGFSYVGSYAGRPGSPATNDTMLFTGVATTGVCPPTSTGSNYAQCTWNGSAFVTSAGVNSVTPNPPYLTISGVSYGPYYQMTPPGDISLWTWVNQGSATTDGSNGSLTINAPANASGSQKILVKSAPATPYSVLARMNGGTQDQGGSPTGRCGVLFRESSTGKEIVFPLYSSSSGTPVFSVDKYTNATTYAGSSYITGQTAPLMAFDYWFKIRDDGSSLTFSFCNDNLNASHCTTYTSQTRTDFLASGPNQVGFYCDSLNATYGMSSTLLDWTIQ